jgi:cell fate (sporulation/competence/biofilm development) regulator YmcA (YheA/YmcA/DUF963 family)
MSDYAQGYLDGVISASEGKINIPALEEAIEYRLRQKLSALLKAQQRNSELNMGVKNQPDAYYHKNQGAIDVIDVLLHTLQERFYIQDEKGTVISSYFLGFNQGMFDGSKDAVNMSHIFRHVAIMDGTANWGIVRDNNSTPLNEDYLVGYYNAVMTLSPTRVLHKVENEISDKKNRHPIQKL